jgi:hypothetical protein
MSLNLKKIRTCESTRIFIHYFLASPDQAISPNMYMAIPLGSVVDKLLTLASLLWATVGTLAIGRSTPLPSPSPSPCCAGGITGQRPDAGGISL